LQSAWLLLLTAFVLSPSARSDPKHHATSPPDLRAYLQSEMQQRRIPGMQVAVVRGGEVVLLENLGIANVEHASPVTSDTVFQIASITKAFTGVALVQLVESGKLDLAAAASSYIDGLPRAWQAVTVRQLATHVSGLPNIMDSTTARLIVDGDPQAAWAKVQSLPMEFPPGDRFSYNQTNYLLLGTIIENLSGEGFTRFVKVRQLDVADMPRTTFADDRDVIPGGATSYTFMRACNRESEQPYRLCKPHVEFPDFLHAAAGLSSTAEEMARWMTALQQGRLFKEKTSLAMLWTPGKLNDGTHGTWAVGWPVSEHAGHRVYIPSGGGKAALGIYPDDDLAIVVLTNLSWEEPRPLVEAIAAYYIPDLQRRRASNKGASAPKQ
jgi:CubicO group peptidase (beta-lactamase class C family)